MSCPSWHELVEALDGAGERTEAASHVPTCTDCQAWVREYLSMRTQVAAHFHRLPPPRAGEQCPDYLLLAAWVEAGRPAEGAVAAHAASCEACAHDALRLEAWTSPASDALP